MQVRHVADKKRQLMPVMVSHRLADLRLLATSMQAVISPQCPRPMLPATRELMLNARVRMQLLHDWHQHCHIYV
ncbi:hypothetical protein DKK66_17310 [Aquitalea sp. USM4]|nr:hypothetical protein DKK66_17310 [Aquitalea sp. USM4]